MSDFSDWTQIELAERPSTAAIEATGTLLVKIANTFSKDYEALAQGTSGQVLLSGGAAAVPTWGDDAPFSIDGLVADTIADADTLAFYDSDGAHNNKITFANFENTLDHDALTNFDANEHYLQTVITNVSTALSTGLLKVTTGTGALSSITDSSANWDTAYNHSQDHSQAHTDYLINNGSDETSGTLTAANFFTTGDITIDSDSSLLKLGDDTDYTIGWDGDDAVHTIIAGSFVFTGGNVGVNTATPTGQFTIKNSGNDTAPLGSELVVNGDFTSDLSSWTAGANWAWEASGTAEHTAGSVETLVQGVPVTLNTVYQVEFTTSNRTAGAVVLTFGAMVGSYSADGNRTYTYSFKATSTASVDLTFTPGTTWNGRLDDVTVKQITGVSDVLMLLEDSDGTDAIEIRAGGGLLNTYIGRDSGQYSTTGYDNTAIGTYVMQANTTGYKNVALGTSVLSKNTTGYENATIGAYVLTSNTTGYRNVGIGASVLYSNTTGYLNVGIGYYALRYNQTGYQNLALGTYSMYTNTIGHDNSAIGYWSLYANTEGYGNTAVGPSVMRFNTEGNYNTAIGGLALYYNTVGDHNVAIGYDALYSITEGNKNIGIGAYAGRYIANGSSPNQTPNQSVYIGYYSKASANGVDNEIVIGYNAIGSGANSITLGGPAATAIVLPNDDQLLQFGAAQDYSIQWDGDDAVHTIIAGSFVFTGGSLKIGDDTDFVEFEVDGTMVMNGAATVWDDIRISALSTKLPAVSQPSFSQFADDGAASVGVFTYMFSDSAEEMVYFIIQMPHGYKHSSDLKPHVHWSPQTTDTGQVDWFLEYTIANVDGTFGNTATITMSDVGDGTINKHQKTASSTIDGTGLTLSHMLVCRLYRDGGQGDDTFVGNAAFLEFDIHYEQDTVGSREELVK